MATANELAGCVTFLSNAVAIFSLNGQGERDLLFRSTLELLVIYVCRTCLMEQVWIKLLVLYV